MLLQLLGDMQRMRRAHDDGGAVRRLEVQMVNMEVGFEARFDRIEGALQELSAAPGCAKPSRGRSGWVPDGSLSFWLLCAYS